VLAFAREDRVFPDEDIHIEIARRAGRQLVMAGIIQDQAYYAALFDKCSRMMLSLLRLPQPVIARVHGMATAAGCQLVATCDLAVASREARFGASGINVGLFCMTPGVALARNLRRKDAFEMTSTGDLIDAERAREIGLVNRTVAPEALDEAVAALAGRILDKSGAAIAAGLVRGFTGFGGALVFMPVAAAAFGPPSPI